MVHGKQSKFQSIGHSYLVVDTAQIILHHLFLGSKSDPYFPVLCPFCDQSYDLQLFWC